MECEDGATQQLWFYDYFKRCGICCCWMDAEASLAQRDLCKHCSAHTHCAVCGHDFEEAAFTRSQ
eukprot:10940069-Karenia_brevis.AAC.1